jgi:hypothetical protein
MRVAWHEVRLEWRKKNRSVPEGKDDSVGAAVDSITELGTCQHDLCRLQREYIITPSLRDGLLFLTYSRHFVPGYHRAVPPGQGIHTAI